MRLDNLQKSYPIKDREENKTLGFSDGVWLIYFVTHICRKRSRERVRGRERGRERDRERDRPTDRQTDGQTETEREMGDKGWRVFGIS